MEEYWYGSYIGPVIELYGRCAIVHPCKETYEYPDQTRKVVAQFDLPVNYPGAEGDSALAGKLLSQGWHLFLASEFQPVNPLPV